MDASTEQRDLRTLLRDRDQWVRMRTRLQHTLQAIAKRDILTPIRLLSGKVNIWLTATRWRRTFAETHHCALVERSSSESIVPLDLFRRATSASENC